MNAAPDATLWRLVRPLEGCTGTAQQVAERAELPGSARLVMVSGAALLRPDQAVFEAMLAGWRAQQQARLLAAATVTGRERVVRRFAEYAQELPWRWTASDVEDWTSTD
jgi:hypothetical protein